MLVHTYAWKGYCRKITIKPKNISKILLTGDNGKDILIEREYIDVGRR